MPKKFVDPSPIYLQGCPVTGMLNLLVKRWIIFILRAIRRDVHSFNSLKRALGGRISSRTLSDRLQDLAKAGIVERRESAGKIEYHFTEKGIAAQNLIDNICQWSVAWEADYFARMEKESAKK